MRHLLCTTLLALATAAALPVQASRLVDMSVVDRDTGATLPIHFKGGQMYVAGTPGHRYSVRLSNRSGGRVLAVLSVDGVNAVSGQTASPDQAGYVLDPWESYEIAGWRKSQDEIAQFNFTALSSSYAARTGRPANVGVIGVAVFAERKPAWWAREKIAAQPAPPPPAPPVASSPAERSAAADGALEQAVVAGSGAGASRAPAPAPSAARPAYKSTESLGTGHGAREYARVDQTTFDRATRSPAQIVSIRYDSYPNLVAMGVIPAPPTPRNPQPFPNSYVPDPPIR